MSSKRTTAGELIAMLSELDPSTHVFVVIPTCDWDYSDAIRLEPVETNIGRYRSSKAGAVHLKGLDKQEATA